VASRIVRSTTHRSGTGLGGRSQPQYHASFLHDLVWQQDAAGFRQRIDTFLKIAAKHKIRPILVLFDSCWDPAPQLGKQRPPTPGVHNSGWVQSPGAKALEDPARYGRLEA